MGDNQTAQTDAKQTQTSATPSETQGASTSQQPETFTKAEVEKMVSDKLAAAGRAAKALESKEKSIRDRESALAKWEAEREEALLESVASEKPEEKITLKAFKDKLRADKQALTAQQEAFNKERAEWEGAITDAKQTRFESGINTLATKHGVSAEVLKSKATKFGITDMTAIEELAEVMPKKIVAEKPDSGKTTGGTSQLTPEMVARMSPDERYARRKEIEKIPLFL